MIASKGGFVAGTLVHTDKGLIPIQDIKIGDMVLSSAENSNGQVHDFKRVTNRFESQSENITQLILRQLAFTENEETSFIDEAIYLTYKNSVFIERRPSEELKNEWLKVNELEEFDGILSYNDKKSIIIHSSKNIVSLNDEKIGICNKYSDSDLDYDTYVKFDSEKSLTLAYDLEFGEGEYENIEKLGTLKNLNLSDNIEKTIFDKVLQYFENDSYSKAKIELPTFNIEVKDYHTFFVGETGIWVHD